MIATLTNASKSYWLGRVRVAALRAVDVEIRAGRFTVLSGPSGSGKTTLLNLIGCLDAADSGQVVVDGEDIGSLSELELTRFRRDRIGFIFQNFNLLPVLTAYENVEYPLLFGSIGDAERKQRVRMALDDVGLAAHADKRPNQLSGGERQRVAIARALVKRPSLILADEPTANLDSRNAAAIMDLMRQMMERYGASFVFSSHDPLVLAQADETVRLRDGMVVFDGSGRRPTLRERTPKSGPLPDAEEPRWERIA